MSMVARFAGRGEDAAMFRHGDRVRVRHDAPADLRPGAAARVMRVTPDKKRAGPQFDQFAPGTIYLVAFEGGGGFEIHEEMLEAGSDG